MKVLQINATVLSSTGGICRGLADEMNCEGINNRLIYSLGEVGDSRLDMVKAGSYSYIKKQALLSKLLGNYGFNSAGLTKKLIEITESYQPDIIHLHNLHTHNCNLEMLFKYFKSRGQRLIWTFHDCWAFTAYCPHFTISGCSGWKTACCRCPQYKEYSLFFDRSKMLFKKKKELFDGLNLTVVTPSKWLENTVRQSFFKNYPVVTIPNGIDTKVFRPTKSNFREAHGIGKNQKMILGVAFDWGYKKGLDVFISIARTLSAEKYRIVLVGADESVKRQLPDNVTAIPRTDSQKELAGIYSAADVFVNPTREEVLGLVNIEANACATPVITFDVGGSPECIDKTSGAVVACGDVDALKKKIEEICFNNIFSAQDCTARAAVFEKRKIYQQYISLYRDTYDGITENRI